MKIDNREIRDIENKIKKLAGEYTPEWHFDSDDPDIGSVIAKLFAVQMKENIDMMNNIPERYHTEFINMLDISLKPVKAAQSLVNFHLIEGTVPGTTIRKGTVLASEGLDEDGEPVLFETDREIYVTDSRITDCFMTDREEGTIVPLLGDFTPVSILEGYTDVVGEEEEPTVEESAVEDEETAEAPVESEYVKKSIRPFVLFAENGNISRSILILYHETVFDINDEPIYVRISGNKELNTKIAAGEYIFKYYNGQGFVPFDSVELNADTDTFIIKKHGSLKKVTDGVKEYGIVTIEAVDPLMENIEIEKLSISTEGGEREPEFINDGSTDFDVEGFAPFSEDLSLYNECYIGEDFYLSKKGAKVTLSFHVEIKERPHFLTKQEEQESLKIIKKKPKINLMDIPAHAYADEVIMEYYNGTGWKKIHPDIDISRVFAGDNAKDVEINFICPNDMANAEAGANVGRCIRFRLLRADNCYLRPCIHHYPYVTDIRLSFTYGDKYVDPNRMIRISGTERRDITALLKSGKEFAAFSGGSYSDDALFLGFDDRMEGGPVSIYFELEDTTNQNRMACVYEYSAIRGFKRMRVVDHTEGFSHSGTVLFYPPSDMKETIMEGRSRFWIKIRRGNIQREEENSMFLPHIRRIMLNVVPVSNIESKGETDFYIDEVGPNHHFHLNAKNIRDAEVWVNEKGYISREEIERLLGDDPDSIRVEYDMMGGYSSVFVKWTETDSFFNVEDRRSYVIDRLTNEIHFSDGMKADIPRVTDDVAFKVRLRTSSGTFGNVEAGTINEIAGTEIFIDSVTNPVRAYGGSNMETVSEAMRRGANIMYGRRRLVTLNDYIFEMLSFSDSIDKVACIPGQRIEGDGVDSDISFVLLMKDFKEGSFSFHRIAAELKEELLNNSSITVSPDRIHIVEPIFVDVSVSVWAETEDIEDSFEITNRIETMLNEYLDPVSGEDREGWEIGTIPKKTQILMKLGSLKSHALIKKTAMVAHYRDKDGEHETDISDLQVTPFMSVRSGKHSVHIVHK
ncbi:MAG: hypothetical protein IJT63_04490 [Lachnospiraceae bacterium]|nr:hypothetical protein [Lachnospiraceae bacterium]